MNPFVADPDWGIWIILYFYLGGIAAGSYFVATLVALLGREEDRAVSRIGYRVALPLIAVCGIFLVVDLERPERFWHMLLQSEVVDRALAEGWPAGGWSTMLGAVMLKRWSPMSIGAWALAIFGLCSTLSFLGTLWPGGRLERWLTGGVFGRLLAIVGCAVGFFVGAYTGVLLTASNQPLWSLSDWIGPLFLASAGSTGIATILLILHWRGGASASTVERLERADLWALGLELFIFLVFLASLQGMFPLALSTAAGWVLVLGVLGLGLFAPLWLHLYADVYHPTRITAAAVLALAGGFTLRLGLLKTAPALLDRWPTLTRGELPAPLWQSAAGVVLIVGTLALAIAIPWTLKRRWRLARHHTLTLVGVSALAYVSVGFYATRPATPWPILEQFALPGFSPELGRTRDGGVGASSSNRPEPDEMPRRSKITGTLPDDQ
jgi:formate-dependent nitrite reductase membrane component NrfD